MANNSNSNSNKLAKGTNKPSTNNLANSVNTTSKLGKSNNTTTKLGKSNTNSGSSNTNTNSNLSSLSSDSNSSIFNDLESKMSNVTKPKSNTVMIVGVVILVIVLAVAGYFIYKYYTKTNRSYIVTKQFIPSIHDASIDKRINYSSVPESSQGNEYNINVWLYVNDYVYRKDEDKCILYKGDVIGALTNAEVENNVNTKCNPSIWLLKNVNTLRVLIGLETKYGASDCNMTESVCGSNVVDSETCDIPNFPLQKWVNLNVSLRSNVLDIFMDGSLVKSCILEGFPIINKGDLYICKDGGFNGYVSNMKYSNKALPSSDISKIYRSGPTLN